MAGGYRLHRDAAPKWKAAVSYGGILSTLSSNFAYFHCCALTDVLSGAGKDRFHLALCSSSVRTLSFVSNELLYVQLHVDGRGISSLYASFRHSIALLRQTAHKWGRTACGNAQHRTDF
ncbi:hypothetical protein AOLI_G00066540 [Acnodon oligacanthus]